MVRPLLRYLRYLIVHKWYVYKTGVMIGVPRIRLLLHDWTKLLPDELLPYTNHFYRDSGPVDRDKHWQRPGQSKRSPWFVAMMKHCNRNPHHWQYWISILYDGETVVQEMPVTYLEEMVADWSGAGAAQGYGTSPVEWYDRNREKVILHPKTRAMVEDTICNFWHVDDVMKRRWYGDTNERVLQYLEVEGVTRG